MLWVPILLQLIVFCLQQKIWPLYLKEKKNLLPDKIKWKCSLGICNVTKWCLFPFLILLDSTYCKQRLFWCDYYEAASSLFDGTIVKGAKYVDVARLVIIVIVMVAQLRWCSPRPTGMESLKHINAEATKVKLQSNSWLISLAYTRKQTNIFRARNSFGILDDEARIWLLTCYSLVD